MPFATFCDGTLGDIVLSSDELHDPTGWPDEVLTARAAEPARGSLGNKL